MRGMIGSVFVLVILGTTTATAQLPPEIMADRYLVQAERLMKEKDYAAALEAMNKIIALQKEHGLTLPDEFHFKYAQVAFSAGAIKVAIDSVNRYLAAAGRAGQFYREALDLLDQAEQMQARISNIQTCAGQPKGTACWNELANQPECYVWNSYFRPGRTVTWTADCSGGLAQGTGTLKWIWDLDQVPRDASPSRADEPKCTAQSKGTSCWMEVTGQPECYVWNPNPQPNETVTWTADCSGGRAQGEGTLTWILDMGKKQVGKGSLQDGKEHGQWVWRDADGSDQERFYVYGERVGRTAEDELVMEGLLVKGKMDSKWVLRFANGTVQEGPYVDGKRHGEWIFRYTGGQSWEGAYLDGKKHGHWVERYNDGSRWEGPYVDGKRHGGWVQYFKDGGNAVGPYVKGKSHGHWVINYAGGTVEEGPYVDGKRRGRWVVRHNDGDKSEGPYVDGKKHGEWVEIDKYGSEKGSYVNGKKHGQWIREREGGYAIRNYEEGKRHGKWVDSHTLNDKRCESNGSYVNDEKHGQWVECFVGNVRNGAYENGEKQGQWVERTRGGNEESGPYVNGKRQGRWVQRIKKGTFGHACSSDCQAEGPYVDGEMHGHWVVRKKSGQVEEGGYGQGKRQGQWSFKSENTSTILNYRDGKRYGDYWRRRQHRFGSVEEDRGLYVDGKKHGQWIEIWQPGANDRKRGGRYKKWEGSYVNGEKQGHWIKYDRKGRVKEKNTYKNGKIAPVDL